MLLKRCLCCLDLLDDPYQFHERMDLKDSDGYDLPNETESVTLRKIKGTSSSKLAFYNDTINRDEALTPQQLKNRNRASLKFQQSEEPVYEDCIPDQRVKPLPPPKPHGLKVRRQKSVHGVHNLPTTKPLNETVLAREFPQIPEKEISVILSISEGNLKEARKDLKFKIFRENMQKNNPMLQSVFCYEVLKRAEYDIDAAKEEILQKYPIVDHSYETL